MTALTEGFNSAFSAMQGHYDRKENSRRYDQRQERQSALDIQNNSRYDDSQDRLDIREGQTTDLHNANMANSALTNTVNQNAVDQIDVNNKRSNTQYNQQQTQYAQQQDQIKQQKAFAELNALQASGNAGEAIYDPKYDNMNVALLRDKGAVHVKQIVEKWDSGDFEGSIPEVNKLFKSQLNKGSGDNVKSKEISNVKMVKDENGEDSLEVMLTVTPVKGEPYQATLTKFRSNNPEDPISRIKMTDLFDTVGGLSKFAGLMEQSGTYARTSQSAQNYVNQGQKSQKIPAKAMNAKYMAQAMGISEGEAWGIINNAKTNPNAVGIAKAKFVQDAVAKNGEYEFATPEQQQAFINQFSQMFDELVGSQSSQQQPNSGQQNPQTGGGSEYSAVLQKAQVAIQGGTDPEAVMQRLLEMGVPQDQINF